MMVFDAWKLLEISNWLSSIGFETGQDYCWAWYNDSWAIEFKDPKKELKFKMDPEIVVILR